MQSIFGTDGIRGRFNKEITYSLAYKVGYALGSQLENNNPILIGRDTRISGDILVQAVTKGINASGKKFINLGICPTPAIPFLIKKENLSKIFIVGFTTVVLSGFLYFPFYIIYSLHNAFRLL